MINLYFVNTKNTNYYSQIFQSYLLGKYLNLEEDKIKILRDKYGKPFLKDKPNIYFNVSHTIDAIICAISKELIGVDIERVKPFNIKITQRYFTKQEQDYIFSNKEKQEERFAEVWTRKEAYVKWIGKGTDIFFQSFDVLTEKNIFSFKFKDYFISLCSNYFILGKPKKLLNFKEISKESLFKN